MQRVSLSLLAIVGLCAAADGPLDLGSQLTGGGDSSPPWFCRDKDCPRFTLEKEKDKYDIRTYEESSWVIYNTTSSKFEVAMGKAFTSLYRYFNGNNKPEVKMDLTTPYLTYMELEDGSRGAKTTGNYTIGLMVPHDQWDDVPKPTLDSLNVTCYPESTFAVRTVGGFATEGSFLEERNKLRDALKDDGIDFEDDWFFAAVYDAPTRLTDRYNEVHIQLKKKKEDEGLPTAS